MPRRRLAFGGRWRTCLCRRHEPRRAKVYEQTLTGEHLILNISFLQVIEDELKVLFFLPRNSGGHIPALGRVFTPACVAPLVHRHCPKSSLASILDGLWGHKPWLEAGTFWNACSGGLGNPPSTGVANGRRTSQSCTALKKICVMGNLHLSLQKGNRASPSVSLWRPMEDLSLPQARTPVSESLWTDTNW